jgi:photosystem II stability/assembly factor-like uncharacterized protein
VSDNSNINPTEKQCTFQQVHLKQAVSIFPALLLILLLVSGTIFAQENRAIKQDLFSVSFSTEQQGWACGRWGTVLYTKDGGQNWIRQKTGIDYTLSSISFTDPQNGWAVGEEGVIIHTPDGGQTWERQTCPVKGFLMGVCFVTDQKGWAVTEWTTILYTEDGGKNWQVQFKGEDYILKSVSFCDPLNGWVAGEYGYIYRTSDGGRTWEHQAGSFAFSEEAFELVGENTLFDIYAVDPQRAWAVGIDGHITRTIDGGATWEKIETNIEMAQLFGVCTDRQGDTILIGGKSILLTSPDRGKSIRIPEINPPVIYGWIYGIARRGSKGFVAVGREGWIYLSDSEAKSWKKTVNVGN